MTKEEFAQACKAALHYQQLDGDTYSYVDYDTQLLCPFCGGSMDVNVVDGKMIGPKCTCEQGRRIHDKLNHLISIIDKATDEVKEIYTEIDAATLALYKSIYIKDIYPQLMSALKQEKEEVLGTASLN
jgi:hypothetical protein